MAVAKIVVGVPFGVEVRTCRAGVVFDVHWFTTSISAIRGSPPP